MSLFRHCRGCLPIFALLWAISPGAAFSQPVDDSSGGGHEIDFVRAVDQLMAEEMERFHLPGAVLVVVKGDEVLVSKGYGYADLERETAVSAASTLFRVASISKLFTTVAVLQLHERGLLDVTQPIAPHLGDIELPLKYAEPLTFHHLLTHTAGFDMTDIGDAARRVEDIRSIEEMVRREMPPQVLPPGRFFSYSNHGFTLAGYLVSQVSGLSYEEYMRVEVLDALGMRRSTFEQPVPDGFEAQLAKSYRWDENQFELPLDYTNVVPADGLVATGDDMAKFMLALLNGGAVDGRHILKRESIELMFRQQFTNARSKYGMAYGFQEEFDAGRRVLEHTGAQLGFLSLLQIFPDDRVGIFISHNNRNNSRPFRGNVADALYEHLLEERSVEEAPLMPPAGFAERAADYVGNYRQVNYPHASFEKIATLFGLFSNESPVRDNGDGTLSIRGMPFVEIAPDIFQHQSTESTWKQGFLRDADGRVTHLVGGRWALERIPWYKTDNFKYPFFWTCLIALALQAIFIPARNLWRRLRRRKNGESDVSTLRRFGGAVQYWSSTCLVLFFVGLLTHLIIYDDQLSDYGIPLSFKFVVLLSTTGAALSLLLPVTTYLMWRQRHGRRGTRIVQTFLNAATMALAAFFYTHNVVGFYF